MADTKRSPAREQVFGTVRDVQHALGLSRNACYALIAAGEISAARIGKRRLAVDLRSLDEYIASLRSSAGRTLADA